MTNIEIGRELEAAYRADDARAAAMKWLKRMWHRYEDARRIAAKNRDLERATLYGQAARELMRLVGEVRS